MHISFDDVRIKNKKKAFCIVGLIIIFYSSVCLITNFSAPNISLPVTDYAFRVDGLNGKIVRNLFLNYDFVRNEGFLTFRIVGSGSIDNLYVEMPSDLSITNASITYFDNKSVVDSSHLKSFDDDFSFKIYDLGNNQIDVFINFTSLNNSFYPNGRIIFSLGGAANVTLSDGRVDGYYRSLLKFDLGEKYKCQSQCFVLEKSINNNLRAFPGNSKVYIVAIDPDRDVGNSIVLTINTFNAKLKEEASLLLNIGLSLLTGVTLGLFFFFMERSFASRTPHK